MSEKLGLKEPVRLATTANITLSGEQTIDGVVTTEDRVLVKNQSTTTQNGIYVSSSGAWTRATDFNGANDFVNGTSVFVTSGSTLSASLWVCTVSTDPPVIGTSTITWAAFAPSSSSGALTGDLAAVEALAATGVVRRTGTDTWTAGNNGAGASTGILNSELNTMAQSTFKGRAASSGTGVPVDLTATQATAILNSFGGDAGSGGLKGLVPATVSGDATKFLKGDGTWASNGAGDMVGSTNLAVGVGGVASAATAFTNIKQAATSSTTGVVELATPAECVTGTDTTRAVTPEGLTSGVKARTESLVIPCSDETTAITASTTVQKITFRMPYAMTLTESARASLTTSQSSGNIFTVDIKEAGTTLLSTFITIDNGEKTSTTAATPSVFSDNALADDAEITIFVRQIGDGTAKGLKVTLIGIRP